MRRARFVGGCDESGLSGRGLREGGSASVAKGQELPCREIEAWAGREWWGSWGILSRGVQVHEEKCSSVHIRLGEPGGSESHHHFLSRKSFER